MPGQRSEPEFFYDPDGAQMAVNFFEGVLKHVKGEKAGQPLILEPWQKDGIINPLFGWKRSSDGTRKYRTAYIEIPRKNGKSTLAAGIGLYLLFADGEPGAEVYSAAADKDQAAIVHDLARTMVEEARPLAKMGNVYKRSIVVGSTNSAYKVISADAFTKHGLNAHGVVIDELHAQPNRELVDVLTTSVGARRQPLVVMITTAGYDRESICYENHEYARQVLDGTIVDPSFFAFISAAEDKDDWMDPDVWAKANPGLGITVKYDYLETKARKAKNVPAFQNTFRRLHLNQWTNQESRWLPMDIWQACGDPLNLDLLAGSECYGGLDLATTSDLASFVLCFGHDEGEPEHYAWIPFFWIPADNLVEKGRKHRAPYDAWVRDGWITATEGNTIDFDVIIRDIEAASDIYNIREIAFDRWGAAQISNQLTGAGLTMVGFGQGFKDMAAPTRDLLRLVLDGKLAHGGHPVLNWMADNMIVSTSAEGNLRPNKQKSRAKIDGMVAGIMALDRATRHLGGSSVYDKRGVRDL